MACIMKLCLLAITVFVVAGINVDISVEYFYHGEDLFCAQLQCTENIREDTQISALVNMSVYRISEPEGKILVASISELDSKLQDYKRAGTKVDGKISKTFSELDIFLSKHSDCNGGIFLCEIHYVNTTGSIDRIGKQTESLQRKSRESLIMMNLKKGDMTMSLQMPNSGGEKFITDKSFGLTDTELNNSYKQINSSSLEDMLDEKMNQITLNLTKALEMMENKSKSEYTNNALAVLMQSMQANSQNQTQNLNIELTEMKSKLQTFITEENNKLRDSIYVALHMNKCVGNDVSSLPGQMTVKLSESKLALCDTKTDGGGWIVIQRRVKGDENFTRNWDDYKNGFGSLAGDYWLGNDWISYLTQNGYNELRFDMKYKSKSYYAVYSNVTVGNEADLYRIKFTYKTGNATDSFSNHNEMAFATFDRDTYTCARTWRSGWWFKGCFTVNMNGLWASKVHAEGIIWAGITQHTDSLEYVEMKLRRL
ncbi:angiopoietin-related protein 7-like [Physella acuta]|uniref:angiopoietin-related protein 7-like n=1 Tax=Physella acuta TaxID=109671 RepID=UPI0027DDC988|nr:angiopoietin-related protein 7-like [Physella acuta]